jgi:hypothetical protein
LKDIDLTINDENQKEVILSLIEEIKNYYIFAEIGEKLYKTIYQKFNNNEYNHIKKASILCEVLNKQLLQISNDKHLRISFSSEKQPILKDPMNDPQWLEEYLQQNIIDNFGFYKLERLPGNIGYIDLRCFAFPQFGGETAVQAMNFLSNTSGLIVDLRNNIGGHPGMVSLIISYFFESESVHPVHISDIYWQSEGITQQYWSYQYLPGKRYLNKPLFILTSKNTFSAAEQFAYELKNMKRATVIGERTMGGANPAPPTQINEYFTAFIPNGRAISPITNSNWEGTGVLPDVEVSQDEAFDISYTKALQNIIDNAEEKNISYKLLEEVRKVLTERNIE